MWQLFLYGKERHEKQMLRENEFNLLNWIYKHQGEAPSQRLLAAELEVSLGTVNALLNEALNAGYIGNDNGRYRLGLAGHAALEPYRVKNAVIMAAGTSSRFAPLSYETPKGLLKVKGEILIEREIRQLKEAGINDITVVVGYMKEKFFYLEHRFGVKIVINEDYYKYNNTSTLIRVLDRLSNTYICSSDNYFTGNVFEQYVYRAYYSAVYSEGRTEEYCLACDRKGLITRITIGGSDSWYMLGHVYFDSEFSRTFAKILKEEYAYPETREHLWESLYIRHTAELKMYIRRYDADKVREFDSLDELREFDPEYINNADSRILKNICRILNCEIRDIVNIEAIKAGLTNTSFKFTVNGESYVYRHPGKGTEQYINRRSEALSMQAASELGLDNTFIYMDSEEGWKISRYIENVRELDYHSSEQVEKALVIMRKLHSAQIEAKYDFDIWKKVKDFLVLLKAAGKTDFEGFDELASLMEKVHDKVVSDGYARKCLCHNDCYSPNFLLDENDNMYLIDWEYSGGDDPASDMGTFICCSDYSFEEAQQVIDRYFEGNADPGMFRHYVGYVAIASYYWFVWALYQEIRGNHVGEWLYLWNKNSRIYGERVLEMYEKARQVK